MTQPAPAYKHPECTRVVCILGDLSTHNDLEEAEMCHVPSKRALDAWSRQRVRSSASPGLDHSVALVFAAGDLGVRASRDLKFASVKRRKLPAGPYGTHILW